MSDPWWRDAAIYQIYPRSFRDSNGDGVGDLGGIADKLDYVAALGVDGIWLSPFFASPMADFGYDVADYCAVDPLFGRLADFDRIVERAHALGLKVLIDMVWAHTSDRHPWFMDSRTSGRSAHADWYVWADPRPDGTPPNNWLSVFGGGAWTWEARRRQYYLHHFLPGQPKLNLRNPAVVAALTDVARFWLERGTDGFRLDAVDFFAHDPALRDNPPAPLAETPVKPYSMQRHLYDLGDSDVMAVIEPIRRLVDRYPGAIMIAEVGSETHAHSSLARAATYIGDRRCGVHAAYSLAQMKSRGDAASIRRAIRDAACTVPDGGMVWAFSNHDVVRVASRWGDGSQAAARLFMALLLSLQGIVFIYQGEELGLPEADVPYEQLRDPYGRYLWPDFKGRDGCRTPMPWLSQVKNADFSRADSIWLPIPDHHRTLAVDRQEGDGDSTLHAWRGFLRWRRTDALLRHGALTLVDTLDPLVAFERGGACDRLLCVFNPSRAPAAFALPGCRLEACWQQGCSVDADGMRFAAYGACIGRKVAAR